MERQQRLCVIFYSHIMLKYYYFFFQLSCNLFTLLKNKIKCPPTSDNDFLLQHINKYHFNNSNSFVYLKFIKNTLLRSFSFKCNFLQKYFNTSLTVILFKIFEHDRKSMQPDWNFYHLINNTKIMPLTFKPLISHQTYFPIKIKIFFENICYLWGLLGNKDQWENSTLLATKTIL